MLLLITRLSLIIIISTCLLIFRVNLLYWVLVAVVLVLKSILIGLIVVFRFDSLLTCIFLLIFLFDLLAVLLSIIVLLLVHHHLILLYHSLEVLEDHFTRKEASNERLNLDDGYKGAFIDLNAILLIFFIFITILFLVAIVVTPMLLFIGPDHHA